MSLMIEDLSKQYSKNLRALKNISFSVQKGECIGIVGESGSGKSTLARILLGLEPFKEGVITFNGDPIAPRNRKLLREYRKNVQMIFQDATSTLNPKLPIWRSLLEPLENYKDFYPSFVEKGLTRMELAEQLLEIVGLEKQMVHRFPHELSGGQKQRVSIARAISLEPSLLVCDEPTASLDVTVQVQILKLLKELQQKTNMTVLFISHDIRAVAYICERVIVLKNGDLVDEFILDDIYDEERHPYTKALIQAASID
ncbi:dipeptide/oligopeptide/nickel ABC transporter ATP-binding protein [Cytobacillus spongiae]|jgi:peptide/nickel transport system ATP-binding protein|uniref:ABC transporter ATP-binding protein n=1 Tax=Cytobacillus spongiae TaxID=2901381 RepID=UPI001F38AF0D|nr:dipeptide/oligopeptide/nickel ABC transporter ATP-binding protein [Cytobacillus spongiae]UII56272.1 dipeptide/oligopeptide/nickel ABC transporter ATP-binding protein [Cytobacillus spongiae]